MTTLRIPNLDWAKFQGPFQVIALIVVVVEVLLAAWLFLAGSASERALIGVFMAAVFIAAMGATVMLSRSSRDGATSLGPGQKPLKPGREEISARQLSDAEEDSLPGPGGHYLISRPPADWKVRIATLAELLQERFQVSEKWAAEMAGAQLTERDVLVMDSPRSVSVVPRLGVTRVNGRKWPSTLETVLRARLMIFPMPREQPPLYMPSPIFHNFFLMLMAFLQGAGPVNIDDVDIDRTSKPGRVQPVARLRQTISHADISGREDSNAELSIVTIGLPGGSMDFFLALHYYTIQGQGADSPDAEVLTRLANSFRPLIPGDTTQQEEAQREIADGRFEAFLQEHGREIFDFELAITLGRIGEAGTTDEQLEDAARVLSPLRELASYIGIEGDEELDVVWAALDDARNGNYESLREVMLEIYEKMDTEEGEQEEVTPPTTVRHHWWLSKLWRRGGTV